MKRKKLAKVARQAATRYAGGYPDKSLMKLADALERKGDFKKEKKSGS